MKTVNVEQQFNKLGYEKDVINNTIIYSKEIINNLGVGTGYYMMRYIFIEPDGSIRYLLSDLCHYDGEFKPSRQIRRLSNIQSKQVRLSCE